MKSYFNILKVLLRKVLLLLGIIFIVFIGLGFTEQPFWAYYKLSCAKEYKQITPTKIVFMGAEGMPSEKNLIRCYYTSKAANKFPEAKVIIALPQFEKEHDQHLLAIIDELGSKGIDSSRLMFETKGINTFTQVKNICKKLNPSDSILVITSPEHMKRTLMCFKKNNIINISGKATFVSDLNPDVLTKDSDSVNISNSLNLRYNIWSQYQYEIIVLREYLAIMYYKFNGFI